MHNGLIYICISVTDMNLTTKKKKTKEMCSMRKNMLTDIYVLCSLDYIQIIYLWEFV